MRKLMLLVVVVLLIMGTLAAPAMAQHTNTCPVNTTGFINIVLPRNYCNDTTFHNERCQNTGDLGRRALCFAPGNNFNFTL